MPIKLPKGFPRRKSSGNVLDDVQNNQPQNNRDSTSSFRVLARPHSSGKSLDAGSALRPGYVTSGGPPRSQSQLFPKASFEEDNEDLFSVVRHDTANRGSGGTSNSLSTNQYDSAASSTRLSSSSTNPSSVDARSDRNVKPANASRLHEDVHAPPPPPIQSSKANFLKNAGRTWSFGVNRNANKEINDAPSAHAVQPEQRSRRETIIPARERAMTASSSITTATAPRLDDSSFSIKEADDDFGNMFAHIESKPSKDYLPSMRPPPLRSARAAPPQPIHVNNAAHVEESPYSWTSQTSNDGLIATPSPSRTVTQASSQPSTLRNVNIQSQQSDASEEDNLFEDSPLRRSPESSAVRPSASPASRPPPLSYSAPVMSRTRAPSNAASSTKSFRANPSEFAIPEVDPALFANAQLATQYEQKQVSPQIGVQRNKVMSPAEFERYRQQKEDTRRYNKVFGKADSDDGSGDDYDDEEEDDQEREKQAVKQRKKQEAHLAVYRQQMMKMTGDIPSPDQHRNEGGLGVYQGGNSSQLDLSLAERRMSSMTLDSRIPSLGVSRPQGEEEEEDEDVPLGILAAHGFPNKNRPPTRLALSSSNPNLRGLAQTQGGTSVAGGESARGGLPAFARNLPVDPYYGASIIQPAERQSLAMHSNRSVNQLVTQPQPSGAATAHPLHPAGLVGVIAGEERARAMRRGSPNPQPATYEMPLGMPSPQQQMGQMQPVPGYPPQGMMSPQQMYSPSEQAQLQMSQSMTQMMQMQMQWMQQMAGMMGQQPNMQMPMTGMPGMQGNGMPMPMPGMPQMMNGSAPPTPPRHGSPQLRPQSAPLQNLAGPGHLPRAMSTLTPSMSGWNYSSPAVPQIHQTGASVYAPSIAPSERSNIGLASRYRPVSTATQEPESSNWAKRASTFTTSTFRPWANENSQNHSKLATTTVRPIQHADDEDDEQGWAEMKARKEKKQKSWKLRRGNTGGTLQELYNAPA